MSLKLESNGISTKQKGLGFVVVCVLISLRTVAQRGNQRLGHVYFTDYTCFGMQSVDQIYAQGPLENVFVQGVVHETRLRCVYLEQRTQIDDEPLAVRPFRYRLRPLPDKFRSEPRV
jgi:hypothetical protein